MNIQQHPAEGRGYTKLSWLESHHSFSFGNYHNPANMAFGALRVLNDDIIVGGTGFGTHPHSNMEIVTLPLQGALEHADSSGGKGVLHPYEIQAMTAGTGIQHSEYNHSATDKAAFLQIWITPSRTGLTPKYQQHDYASEIEDDRINFLIAPNMPGVISINQSAHISLARMTGKTSITYPLQTANHGVYVFVISGSASISGTNLNKRDAASITNADAFELTAAQPTEILLIEVPLLNKN